MTPPVRLFVQLRASDSRSCCSEQKCDAEVPPECADIVPYTSYPNERLGLKDEESYKNLSMAIKRAINESCGDHEMMRWGACNLVFPRCLLGWELQMCRRTCRSTEKDISFFIDPTSRIQIVLKFATATKRPFGENVAALNPTP